MIDKQLEEFLASLPKVGETAMQQNIAAARTEHVDRENIERLAKKHTPHEQAMRDLLNAAVPGLNLSQEKGKYGPFDLGNENGLRIEIERGDWDERNNQCFPTSEKFTMNILSRKNYAGSDVFIKFDKNLKSGFIILCRPIVEWINSGKIVPVSNPAKGVKAAEFQGTNDKVYKLSRQDRSDLAAMNAILMVSRGNYSEIEKFFRKHGFLK